MSSRPLAALQVVGIRYYGDRSAANEPNCLDSYADPGVYGAAGVPFDVIEPRFPDGKRTGDPTTDSGFRAAAFAVVSVPAVGPGGMWAAIAKPYNAART